MEKVFALAMNFYRPICPVLCTCKQDHNVKLSYAGGALINPQQYCLTGNLLRVNPISYLEAESRMTKVSGFVPHCSLAK